MTAMTRTGRHEVEGETKADHGQGPRNVLDGNAMMMNTGRNGDVTARMRRDTVAQAGLRTKKPVLVPVIMTEVQAKAQAEIDAVMGTNRLPLITDRASFPYVGSLVTEVYRWNPAVPLYECSIPLRVSLSLSLTDVSRHPPCAERGGHVQWHSSFQRICRDAKRLVSVLRRVFRYQRAQEVPGSRLCQDIPHDPMTYIDPMDFKPERYGNSDVEMQKVTDLAFGFGWQACLGFYLP